jgi:hypothetical protein
MDYWKKSQQIYYVVLHNIEFSELIIMSYCVDTRWSTWLVLILAVVFFYHTADYVVPWVIKGVRLLFY